MDNYVPPTLRFVIRAFSPFLDVQSPGKTEKPRLPWCACASRAPAQRERLTVKERTRGKAREGGGYRTPLWSFRQRPLGGASRAIAELTAGFLPINVGGALPVAPGPPCLMCQFPTESFGTIEV